MELTDSLKAVFIETANTLKGSTRRLFMARIVRELGAGGQRLAQRELGWNRDTLRKGGYELRSGVTCAGALALRGRKPAEARLPHLLDDIRALVDGQSQTDPQFRNQRLYTRLTAAEVRRQLILQKGYTEGELPWRRVSARASRAWATILRRCRRACPKKDCRNRRHL